MFVEVINIVLTVINNSPDRWVKRMERDKVRNLLKEAKSIHRDNHGCEVIHCGPP